jgi:Tfp pilus assembly protein PilV
MRTHCKFHKHPRGTSLIEAVIATGVLAVAVPLVFGAFAESGKTGISAEAETRSIWIVPRCMQEIQASREGRAEFFESTVVGQTFPTAGDVWAIAFSGDGTPIGKVSRAAYDRGINQLDGSPIRYIGKLSATVPAPASGQDVTSPDMLLTCVSLEYPAASPALKRQKVDFYSQIP